MFIQFLGQCNALLCWW